MKMMRDPLDGSMWYVPWVAAAVLGVSLIGGLVAWLWESHQRAERVALLVEYSTAVEVSRRHFDRISRIETAFPNVLDRPQWATRELLRTRRDLAVSQAHLDVLQPKYQAYVYAQVDPVLTKDWNNWDTSDELEKLRTDALSKIKE